MGAGPEPQPTGAKQLVAFLENWLPCPSLEKVKGYTKVMISFAVSYTWSPDKNQCSASCTIGSPVPVCDNNAQPGLVQQWQAAGTKVLLSFGGAGMGGSWAGDPNDCWEHCFDKADSVVSQLTTIVTTRLKASLGEDKVVSHAPMDGDLSEGSPYYNLLQEVAPSVDFLMPQYYNGPFRPAIDPAPALEHYGHLVDGIFDGNAGKVLFGFCISDCAGTGSNVNGAEAAEIMEGVVAAYPASGGAFFWAASHDAGWSGPLADALL